MLTLSEKSVAERHPLIALVGNPNAGKSSLFNLLTGSNQRIANYPGVTVEKVTGTVEFDGTKATCVDVPGLYSLTPLSMDEDVAAAVIQSGYDGTKPDLLVCVIDAANLERNLFFFSQLAELRIPLVVALTMVDVLARDSRSVDVPKLAELLGVPVVQVLAHKGGGLEELKLAIDESLSAAQAPAIAIGYPEVVNRGVRALADAFEAEGRDAVESELRGALLATQSWLDETIEASPKLAAVLAEQQRSVLGKQAQGKTIDAQARYAWSASVARKAIDVEADERVTTSAKIDSILTHRVFGLVIFTAVMFLVFQSIYTVAAPLMGWIDSGIAYLITVIDPLLASMPTVQSLVTDGVIRGIGSVLIFLPQICILFFFIAVLEGSGYLARAAFLMDRLLGWTGLNGRAFIPLLSSFACAIPGIMAARVMPDEKSRIATIMVAPLMSCSARLPVYVLIIGAFIEPQFGAAWAGMALFGMHFVGVIVAVPVVLFLNRKILKGKRPPFLMELPRYQMPVWRNVWLTLYSRARVFLQTAGTIIFAMSVLIWALLYFPRPADKMAQYSVDYDALRLAEDSSITRDNYVAHRQNRDSYLGRFGRSIEPVFAPAGFDWRLTTAILAAFPAREVVIPALGIIFSLGGDIDAESGDLRAAISGATWPDGRQLLTPWTAVGFMVFFALCCQCAATLATIKRETNSWKWPVASFIYMTVLAYLLSVAIHQLGKVFG
ncbi:MAG: ferrous iron transport protein B [Armatimonadetes bacterium]|nr:ferrous iron transport protein B [Armatimonadota bacterium]